MQDIVGVRRTNSYASARTLWIKLPAVSESKSSIKVNL